MRVCSLFVLLLLCGATCPTRAQTSADFKSRYPQIVSYQVRPGVLVTPIYDDDGQVCRMVVEKQRAAGNKIVFGLSFSNKEVKEIVDQLAPRTARGQDLTPLLNTTVNGGFIETDYSYENILVRAVGVTRPEPMPAIVITISWRNRTCAQPH